MQLTPVFLLHLKQPLLGSKRLVVSSAGYRSELDRLVVNTDGVGVVVKELVDLCECDVRERDQSRVDLLGLGDLDNVLISGFSVAQPGALLFGFVDGFGRPASHSAEGVVNARL